MGKRGPTAKGEYGDKSAVLSTRISQELRDRLTEAVEESGLTLSREIERRLRRSFSDDDFAADTFGTRRNRALMKMIAMVMEGAHNPDHPEREWLDDPWLFDQVVKTIVSCIEPIRPPGPIIPPSDPILSAAAEARQHTLPARLWHDLQNSDPSLPLDASRSEHLRNVVASDLGEVVHRPKIFRGTADDFRKEAQRLERLENSENAPAKPSAVKRKTAARNRK